MRGVITGKDVLRHPFTIVKRWACALRAVPARRHADVSPSCADRLLRS